MIIETKKESSFERKKDDIKSLLKIYYYQANYKKIGRKL